jgi:hypothetical protein
MKAPSYAGWKMQKDYIRKCKTVEFAKYYSPKPGVFLET